jgi:hypothetical protein
LCNLVEAITRLHQDLDRVEMWTAVLGCFLQPVPQYHPGEHYLLPTRRAGKTDAPGASSGKADTGFPSENSTKQKS